MRFGANTFIWADHFDPEQTALLDRLRHAGFDGIEIPLMDPQSMRTTAVRRAIERSGLACTVCSVLPRGLNAISEDASIRQMTREHLARCIAATAELGASVIAGPLYAPVGYLPGHRRTQEEWKRAVDCFQQLGPALDEYNVHLAIEPLNRYETYFLNIAADAVQLCRQIQHRRIGILFDTYHANIEEKNIGKAISACGSHLFHVHSCENDRGIPGSGHVDWANVAAALQEIGYDGWLTIEGFGFSLGTLSAAASIWRDLAPTPDDIAFEGLPFLQKLMSKANSNRFATS
jgi:D-psicose/D-tagatose/L-ribulose 3-epimerase